MPTPEQYLEVAHALARGRDHRLRHGCMVLEEIHPNRDVVGAWVPIDVWIPASEVVKMQLEREGSGPLEPEERIG